MAQNKEVEKIHQQGLIRIDDKLCDYNVVVVWDTEAGHEIHTKCCLDIRECVSYVQGIELGSGLDNLPTSITSILSRYPFTPLYIEITCSGTVNGEY